MGWLKRCVGAVALVATMAMAGTAFAAKPPYKIYLSMSYIGNDWQTESLNMIKAMAADKEYRDIVNLRIQVAGTSAERQSQQIDAMVQAGADAIIMYAVSPTLLNRSIRSACQAGVIIITYDSPVTEPCAHNISANNTVLGHEGAQWLVDALKGKGRIVMVNGVPGTSADNDRIKAAKAVFAKYPGIHIIAETSGMWSQAITRSALSKVLATHPWSEIDGLWMQMACYQAGALEDEAGIPDSKKRPCTGGGDNGSRIQLLPSNTAVPGASGAYRPMGYPGISLDSPLYQAALGLKWAVAALQGKMKIPATTYVPLSTAETGDVKLCQTGSWQEMKAGCNVFAPSIIKNPGWYAGIYSPLTPEVGLAAALNGTPEQ